MTPTEFSPATTTQLDRADALCSRQGGRMTQQRREILGLILDAKTPVGAYDLLEKIKTPDRRPAPPTVYRALDFLLEHGLIHRIERLSAFVPCTHLLHDAPGHNPDHCHDHDHDTCLHTAQFLICKSCKSVTEIADSSLLTTLRGICREQDFVMQGASIEVVGLCADCAAKARPAGKAARKQAVPSPS
ncbi:Fur family transcriptional regulator [Acetobacter malorum]|uniref:Fur family transcriptional regulator n=1 Tax=Acetobacter malorum TaxID=178901 RepID=UPI000A3C66CF|nr:Fur family transcriptional regulator [Acetobacter malorum]